MGTCCGFFLELFSSNSSEYTPINTINDNLQPKSKQSEKYFDNYQVIVDKASSNFLHSKSYNKNDGNSLNSVSLQTLRSKIGQATVSSTVISESPPSTNYSAISRHPKSSPTEHNIVKLLSKNTISNNNNRKNTADNIASIISQQNNNIKARMNDNSAVVSFKSIEISNNESKK